MSVRKRRNFTAVEVEAIVNGVEKRQYVLKGSTQMVTYAMRGRGWAQIAEEVNAVCPDEVPRSVTDIKKKFKNIQFAAKLRVAKYYAAVANGDMSAKEPARLYQRVESLAVGEAPILPINGEAPPIHSVNGETVMIMSGGGDISMSDAENSKNGMSEYLDPLDQSSEDSVEILPGPDSPDEVMVMDSPNEVPPSPDNVLVVNGGPHEEVPHPKILVMGLSGSEQIMAVSGSEQMIAVPASEQIPLVQEQACSQVSVDVPSMPAYDATTQTDILNETFMNTRLMQGERQLQLLEAIAYGMERQAAALESVAAGMSQCLELLSNQNR